MLSAREFLDRHMPHLANPWEAQATAILQRGEMAWPWVALEMHCGSIRADFGHLTIPARRTASIAVRACTRGLWTQLAIPEGLSCRRIITPTGAHAAIDSLLPLALDIGDVITIDFHSEADAPVSTRIRGDMLVGPCRSSRTCAICDGDSGVFCYCTQCVFSGRAPAVFHGSISFERRPT